MIQAAHSNVAFAPNALDAKRSTELKAPSQLSLILPTSLPSSAPLTTATTRSRSSLLSDFKDFINKGNVVDLAVAVVIGGAFGKVVDAVVSLVMGSVLEPAMKAANVASLASWPAGQLARCWWP